MSLTLNGPNVRRPNSSEQSATSIVQLQRQLLTAVDASAPLELVIPLSLQLLRTALRPAAILYYRRDPKTQAVVPAPEQSPPGTGNIQGDYQSSLTECCQDCAKSGDSVVRELNRNLAAIAVPVQFRAGPPETIGILAAHASNDAQAGTIAMLQAVAAHIVLADAMAHARQAEAESASSAALFDLLAKCNASPSLKHASVILANELKEFLGCKSVAIALTVVGKHECRLTAVSDMSKFDAHSEFVTAIEAAMDEAIVKDTITLATDAREGGQIALLAHQRALDFTDGTAVVSSPIKDETGAVLGAWMFFTRQQDQQQLDRISTFVRSSRDQVGSNFNLLSKATQSPLQRQLRFLRTEINRSRTKTALLLSAVFLGLMLLPARHKISCECQVQPVVRRFVAAPYDGTLERTFVEPGDQVSKGDLLARLDGRELRWELAGLEADCNRATKKRDAAMAVDSIGEAQQAALEKERLTLKIELIENRLDNLEIRSPLDGIVVSGDLRKAEGAPLAIGQTMFEIAPLERMILEVEIPERDVLHAEAGQQVSFRVDANPFEAWTGEIRTVFPRAEVRDNESIFLAEVDLQNHSAELRPGMKGRAKVISGRRTLGWTLFHRPYESFCMLVGW